ncbi:MAG: hypothetical protein K1X74_04255 [Pirellulales bacterium]|nr:hypothetical protein [Pirellulales bacterium]
MHLAADCRVGNRKRGSDVGAERELDVRAGVLVLDSEHLEAEAHREVGWKLAIDLELQLIGGAGIEARRSVLEAEIEVLVLQPDRKPAFTAIPHRAEGN